MLKGRCVECGNSVWKIELVRGRCLNCHDDEAAQNDAADDVSLRAAEKAAFEERERAIRAVLLTTETAGLLVEKRLGVIAAECALGMNIFRDFAAGLRDVFGGRSEAVQKSMREARETALYELRKEALALGADAVVGVDLDYSEIGGASMILIVASGTAVRLALPRELVERV